VSVTTPAGFRAAGATAGLKPSGSPDVAVVVNDGPSDTAAGVFTTNRVQAAPVQWSKQVLADGRLRAVVLNSGGANACTGPAGFADTHATAEHAAGLLSVGAGEVAVCSTGLIGTRLPMNLLLPGVSAAIKDLSVTGGPAAAEAIRTTDTVAKEAVARAGGVTVGGMAKGAAMLAPALATMLVVITTDAVLEPAAAGAALRRATDLTFQRIDSDGCLSTNDSVLLLASGASGITPSRETLTGLLTDTCAELSQRMLADAEGSTKTISITVGGAASETEAVDVGRAIARTNLLKCALNGNDPNWGRVLAAIGTTSATFEPDQIDVAMNGVWVCRAGAPGEPRENCDLSGRAIAIEVNLRAGPAQATVWTNDLSEAYVYENSAYST